MSFRTEHKTEDFLTQEIRSIAHPSGKVCFVSGLKLMWKHYDFLVTHSNFDVVFLVKTTLESCAETGLAFDIQFHEIVGCYSYIARDHPVAAQLPILISASYLRK